MISWDLERKPWLIVKDAFVGKPGGKGPKTRKSRIPKAASFPPSTQTRSFLFR